jgi:hypothetical protein
VFGTVSTVTAKAPVGCDVGGGKKPAERQLGGGKS